MQIRLYNLNSAKFALQNIEQRHVKISRIADLNDPFELIPANLADRSQRKLFRRFKDSFDKDHGVLCFSRTWKNPVLWSHYAEKHFGICLGFDVDESFAFPITYVNALHEFDAAAIEAAAEIGLDFGRDEAKKILATKFSHWQYEDEMRVFIHLDHSTAQNGLYFHSFSPEMQLREVIIGARCNVSIQEICEAVRKISPDIQVRKARLAFSSFDITEDLRFCRRIARYMQRSPTESL